MPKKHRRFRYPGRTRLPDREALCGILFVLHTGIAWRHLPLVGAVPPVRGHVGRPRRRPERLIADRGYDHNRYRRELWQRGITPVIGRRSTEHGSGLGRLRWVVERTFAWLHQFRRLLVRYERRAEIHEAFLGLACCRPCFRRLTSLL